MLPQPRKQFYMLLLTLAFAVCLLSVGNAQGRFPIQVYPILTPPYSLRLSDYAQFGSQRLVINVQVQDATIANLPVRLHIKFENFNGSSVENIPNFPIQPIYLNGGETRIFFGEDLAPYFNPDNLIFNGYSREQYRRTGQLPEGYYRVTAQIRHYYTNRLISNIGFTSAHFALGKPPILLKPDNEVELGNIQGAPLTFSWQNSRTIIPGANVQYKFELWELRLPGINPYVYVNSMPPFYTEQSFMSPLQIYPAMHNFEPGMKYAWRVTAGDIMDLVPFEQDGKSEVRVFTFMSKCDPPANLKVEQKGRDAVYSWTPNSNHTSYTVEAEDITTGTQRSYTTYNNKYTLQELDYGHEYRLRVRAICNGNDFHPSDFTEWVKFKLAEPPKPDSCPTCSCEPSKEPIPEITNFELRRDLKAGDTVRYNRTNFVILTANSMGDGVYEGQFLALWRFTGVAFKANYKYLRVNTDNQCLDDFEYETVYNPDLLIDVDEVTETINDIAEILETFFGSLDELTNQFYDDIQDGNRDPEDAINDFINTLKDSISNNPNIPEEEKETLLYYVSSDDYREVLVEAVKDPTNYEVFNNNVITPLRNPNTDGGYYLTINGKKALKLDKKRIEDRFNVTSKWRDEVSIGNLDAYLEANRIRLYVLNDPNVNDYKISIKNFKSNGQSQNAANLYFDNAKTEREKDINFSHSTRSLSDIIVLFYNRPNVNEDYTSAVYEIELVRVTPNIAYKQGNVTRGLILKEDVNTVSLLGDKVLLCPVFLTGEDGELKSENIDKVISERNSSCFHLVDTILFNYEKQDVEVAMGWKEYTLGNESSIYEIKFSNENNNRIKGIIEHEQSPFATVARSNSNKNTGYYIEDFYSSFISPTSTLLNGNVNNADGINFGNSSPYKMPIVHYKGNVTDIMLQLAAVNDNGSGIRIINESEKLEYNIGDKPVMLGGERSVPITVKPQDKNTVDITDMYSNTRGKIEFRQISGEELPPILNIVTINGDPDGINDYIGFLDSVLTNINGIYSAMNIKWQRGRHIPINVSGFDRTIGISGNEGMKDNIIEILGNYDSKQYYMIVVSNLSSENDINGFTEYNERNGTNWFFVRNDLNSANEDANTYAHELGHCNGLHEYAVDIGLVAANKREAIINSPAQRETTNVMGYGRNKPLKDFFSWQIEIIRRLMKNRIE